MTRTKNTHRKFGTHYSAERLMAELSGRRTPQDTLTVLAPSPDDTAEIKLGRPTEDGLFTPFLDVLQAMDDFSEVSLRSNPCVLYVHENKLAAHSLAKRNGAFADLQQWSTVHEPRTVRTDYAAVRQLADGEFRVGVFVNEIPTELRPENDVIHRERNYLLRKLGLLERVARPRQMPEYFVRLCNVSLVGESAQAAVSRAAFAIPEVFEVAAVAAIPTGSNQGS